MTNHIYVIESKDPKNGERFVHVNKATTIERVALRWLEEEKSTDWTTGKEYYVAKYTREEAR